MALTTLDGYAAAPKQVISWVKTASRTSVAFSWFSIFDLAGQPGAGVLAGGETTPPANTAGRVTTNTIPGYPAFTAFSGANLGYLSRVDFSQSVAARISIYDRLWCGGAYAFNAAVAVTASSYSSRIPSGTDYNGLELWVEAVTASTLNLAVNVTYTNQSAATGHTTGATGIGATTTVGRCWQLPLQAGDSGVQTVTNVAGSVASAGTFNVMVLRPLWSGRVNIANYQDTHDMLKTGLPQVWSDSALFMMINADSTSTGLPDMLVEIVNA